MARGVPDPKRPLISAKRSVPAVLQSLPSAETISLCFLGNEKEHKPRLLGPDIFRWGGGLPHEVVRAKKFGMSLEIRGKTSFSAGYSGMFAGIFRGVPEKFEKNVCVQFLHPKGSCFDPQPPSPLIFPVLMLLVAQGRIFPEWILVKKLPYVLVGFSVDLS